MKKEEQAAVDQYFQQHEADIPVTFNPKHWQQLAATLDSAARAEPPLTPSSGTRKPFRAGKGWWVSGVWVLAFLTSAWVLTQYVNSNTVPASGNPVEEERAAPATEVAPESTYRAPALPPASDVPAKTSGRLESQSRSTTLSDDDANANAQNKTDIEEVGTDTLQALHPIRPAPSADSTATLQAPAKKKKKYLFW